MLSSHIKVKMAATSLHITKPRRSALSKMVSWPHSASSTEVRHTEAFPPVNTVDSVASPRLLLQLGPRAWIGATQAGFMTEQFIIPSLIPDRSVEEICPQAFAVMGQKIETTIGLMLSVSLLTLLVSLKRNLIFTNMCIFHSHFNS